MPQTQTPAELAPQLVEFCEELRAEGMSVGTSELLDAFQAIGAINWAHQSDFREALAATLAKSSEDRHLFKLVYDRYFFRATEAAAIAEQGRNAAGEPGEGEASTGDQEQPEGHGAMVDAQELRAAIVQALQDQNNEGTLRDLARLAMLAFGAGQGTGVVGVDVQRIRRLLELRIQDLDERDSADSVSRERLREFERHLRRELEADAIERVGQLPPVRPLNQLNRALPTGASQDLAAVHRSVMQMKRAMATQGHVQRGRRRTGAVDVRHTMRSSLETGGVPVNVKYRPRKPRRPEIYVLCDVSTSVTSASVFFLSILHALHDSFKRLRSFVFIERVAEVTEVFEQERSFKTASERISKTAGVADLSGYTDYGRVWIDFLEQVQDDLDHRSSVIVLGDARTNGRDPRVDLFKRVSDRAGRTFWLNPEPRLYWNYGDSVIGVYEQHCDVFECWTTKQLEGFVRELTAVSQR